MVERSKTLHRSTNCVAIDAGSRPMSRRTIGPASLGEGLAGQNVLVPSCCSDSCDFYLFISPLFNQVG